MENPIDTLLNSKLFQQVRFGGFLGKVVLFGSIVVIALAFVGYHTGLGVLSIYAILGVVLMCLILVAAFAFKYPQLATLEGSEVITLHQIQQVASKASLSKDQASASPVLEGANPNRSLEAKNDDKGGQLL